MSELMRAILKVNKVLTATSLLIGVIFNFALGARANSAESVSRKPIHPTIQVRPIVEIESDRNEITLGDILIVRGIGKRDIDELMAVRLGDAPASGESRMFSDVGLLQLINEQLEFHEIKDVQIRCPSRVRVTKMQFRFSKEDITRLLQSSLGSFKSAGCENCSFEVTDLSLPILTDQQRTKILSSKWKLRPWSEMPRGSFSIGLDLTANERQETWWISGQIKIRRPVPVARRALAMGEKISPVDYSMQLRDVTFSRDSEPTSVELKTSIVARSLGADEIIWRGALRREFATKYGQPVKVMAGREGWQVMIDGVSQVSAYVGDSVKVKIPSTNKMITGLLKENGIVEIQ